MLLIAGAVGKVAGNKLACMMLEIRTTGHIIVSEQCQLGYGWHQGGQKNFIANLSAAIPRKRSTPPSSEQGGEAKKRQDASESCERRGHYL